MSTIIFAFSVVIIPLGGGHFLPLTAVVFLLDIHSMQTYDAAMNVRRKVRTTVTLTANQADRLKRQMKLNGWPLSWQVREAVGFWLANCPPELPGQSAIGAATLRISATAPLPAKE